MRWWLLGVPAGIGFATLRAILRLWMGSPPARSGVWSAGNGPAMRSAVLGAAVSDLTHLRALVQANTLITHSDPRAFAGALAIALAARQSAQASIDGMRLIADLRAQIPEPAGLECADLIQRALTSIERAESSLEFAEQLGCKKGVSGFVLHTVPVAIHLWLSFPQDYAGAIEAAVGCGGDTDTVAAIVGGIVGARVGTGGIPSTWIDGLFEWPRSVRWIRALADATERASATGLAVSTPAFSRWALPLRQLLFLLVVLAHVARRMLPPY